MTRDVVTEASNTKCSKANSVMALSAEYHHGFAHAQLCCLVTPDKTLSSHICMLMLLGLAMQVPASQPLLVLATCQCPADQLPSDMINFFQTHPCPVPTAAASPSASADAAFCSTEQNASGPAGKMQHHASSAVVSTSAAEELHSSWQDAVSRSAEAAARTVAAAAAQHFHKKLLQQLPDSSLGTLCQVETSSSSGQQVLTQQGQNGEASGTQRDTQVGLEQTAFKGSLLNANAMQKALRLHAEVSHLCSLACLTQQTVVGRFRR